MEFVFSHATFKQRGEILLNDITVSVADESYAIRGGLGSGKSLFLKALALKLSMVSGERKIIHHGKEIGISECLKLIRLVNFSDDNPFTDSHSYFYQQRYHSDMGENSPTLNEYLSKNGLDGDNVYHKDLLHRCALATLLDRQIIQLSNGQRLKMQLIKALISKPSVLMLDNPFVGLDTGSREDITNLLYQLHQEDSIQFFFIVRDDEIPAFISKEIEIAEGSVKFIGDRSNRAEAKIEINEKALKAISKIWTDRTQPIPDQQILELNNVSVQYQNKKIVDDVSWTIGRGSKVALLGKNGSGKSTLLSLIFADNPLAYSNEIFLFGRKLGPGRSIWSLKKKIGFASPELRMYMDSTLKVDQIISTGLFDTYSPNKKVEAKDLELIDLLLTYFDMEHVGSRTFNVLSSGQQQIVIFIRALVQSPELLLLDEPYQGLDWAIVKKSNYLLTMLLEKSDVTLLFVSHFAHEIPEIVDEYYHIDKGKLSKIEK